MPQVETLLTVTEKWQVPGLQEQSDPEKLGCDPGEASEPPVDLKLPWSEPYTLFREPESIWVDVFVL